MNEEMKLKKSTDSSVIAKAGIWFTVCSFLFRGLAFFTVPIFTRLLTKADLGSFSNYSSWITILMVITSFDLSTSIIRSKVEHENDIDSYIWSVLAFSTSFTLALYVLAILNSSFVTRMLQMDMKYVHLMFLYFLASPAYSMLVTKHRAFYKYKMFVLITAIITISSTTLSIFLVFVMQDKLWARALGQYLPSILSGMIIFVYLAYKGKYIKPEYCKYALVICVPLVPHTLASNILNTSDRVVLTQICGSEATAIYSVACSCYSIVTILMHSMNKAWTPWLFESLEAKEYKKIRSFSKIYMIIFVICAWGVMLIGPEVILLFGGSSYRESVYCLVPLMTSCIIQFMYLLYVNVEFYSKRTVGVAIVTMISAGVNIALNYLFIPMFPERGYVVASYTTLVGFLVLLSLHYLLTRRLKMTHVYDTRFFALLVVAALLFMVAISILYKVTLVRYIVTALYVSALLIMLLKYQESVKAFLKRK